LTALAKTLLVICDYCKLAPLEKNKDTTKCYWYKRTNSHTKGLPGGWDIQFQFIIDIKFQLFHLRYRFKAETLQTQSTDSPDSSPYLYAVSWLIQ